MGIDVISAARLPYLDCVVAVVASRGDIFPVRGPRDAAHKAGMAAIDDKGYLFLKWVFCEGCPYIPDMRDTFGISGCDVPAIRRPGHRKHTTVVTAIDVMIFAGGGIPHPHGCIPRTRGNRYAIRRP